MANLIDRIASWIVDPPTVVPTPNSQRAIWTEDDGRIDLTALPSYADTSAKARRTSRSNSDLVAAYSAIYTATRIRSRAIARPRISLVRKSSTNTVDVPTHPALDLLSMINASLPQRNGISYVETQKLAFGSAFWIKRRDRLGRVAEFDIWNPEHVTVVRRPDARWIPAKFIYHAGPNEVSVDPTDVVWFRHMIDPRDILVGLTPISAVRMMSDTTLEAQRYNQKFFDNGTMINQIFALKEGTQLEASRIADEIERRFAGTDNMHRVFVGDDDLTHVTSSVSHADMEYLGQMKWGVREVAMVFEMSGVKLNDSEYATLANVEQFNTDFWEMIRDQLDNTLSELNAFLIWPDYGRESSLIAHYDDIAALQVNRKFQAEVDKIRLDAGLDTINELRKRDSLEAVPWGDLPLISQSIKPLGATTPPEVTPTEPRAYVRNGEAKSLHDVCRRMIRVEARRLFDHLARRAVVTQETLDDVRRYGWVEWFDRHRAELIEALYVRYLIVLLDTGLIAGGLVDPERIARQWATARVVELLTLSGRFSIVATTRDRIIALVEQAISTDQSIATLRQRIVEDGLALSDGHADLISETEDSLIAGDASLRSYTLQGYEGKAWRTAGPHPEGICIGNEEQGPIRITEPFSSGHMSAPAHPRCQCVITAVGVLPTRKQVIRDQAGNIIEVIERK